MINMHHSRWLAAVAGSFSLDQLLHLSDTELDNQVNVNLLRPQDIMNYFQIQSTDAIFNGRT